MYLCTRINAPVAELVDALDLGSSSSRCVGSSPIRRTKGKRGCVKIDTLSFFAQSPDFLKPGLCYFLKFLYL